VGKGRKGRQHPPPSEPAAGASNRGKRWLPVAVALALVCGVSLWLHRRAASQAPVPDPAPAPRSWRWVSGDMHLHAETSGGKSVTSTEFVDILKGEGLEVGVVHVWGVRAEVTSRSFTGRAKDFSTKPLLHYDLEVSSFYGLNDDLRPGYGGGYPDHVVGLGLQSLDFPRRLFTFPITAWAHSQGAVTGVAHAGIWPGDRKKAPLRPLHAPAELPACLALGQRLFLSTEHVAGPGFYRLYYGLLNCGFEVPLCAGSDWPVAGGPPGHPRTYVKTEGPLTYEGWIEGIRAGHTTISGNRTDLLEVEVEGEGSGERLSRGPNSRVRVVVRFRLAEAQIVEVVCNGTVITRFRAEDGEGAWSTQLSVWDSCWIVVRTKTAHTGPVYVDVEGRTIRASVTDAAYFRTYLDNLLEQIDKPTFVWKAKGATDEQALLIEAERAEAKATYEAALPVWDSILKEARERKSFVAKAREARRGG
jgi:hypothetical protein